MNILFLSHEYPPLGGGGANACRNLALQFAKHGHAVHIVTSGYGNLPERECLEGGKIIIDRVKAKRKNCDHSKASEMLDYLHKAYRLLDSATWMQHFDICLCFFGIPSGPLALHLKKKYGVPYIIRFGGGDIPGFQDRFAVLYKLLSPELQRIWKNADALIANSAGLQKYALDYCSKFPVKVIPNGVDTEQFSPIGESLKKDTFRLLTVCRLIKRKGLQDVIPFIKPLEQDTGKSIRWTIVGAGPYREDLEKLAVEWGCHEKIKFLGERAQSELPHLYHDADLFVFPSHREGMPNAVLEAMASGLPVIMRKDCQGSFELIHNNGISSDENFIRDLKDLIHRTSPELKSMGERSRQIVIDRFTWECVFRQYEDVIKQVTNHDT